MTATAPDARRRSTALAITDAERERLAGALRARPEPLAGRGRRTSRRGTSTGPTAPPPDASRPPNAPATVREPAQAEEGVLRRRLDHRLPEPAARRGGRRGRHAVRAGLLERPHARPARRPHAGDPAHRGRRSRRACTQVLLEIHVAGRTFTQSFAAAPNLQHAFTWDGKDAYGRRPAGRAAGHDPARLPVRPRQVRRPGGGARRVRARVRGRAARSTAPRGRMDFVVWQCVPRRGRPARSAAGTPAGRRSAAGRSTSHHAYDPYRRTVYLGDGRTLDAEPVDHHRRRHRPAVLVPATAQPATQAPLGYANDVAVAPDGSVYVGGDHRARRRPLRRIRTRRHDRDVAGQAVLRRRGGPAASATLGIAARHRGRPGRQRLPVRGEPRPRPADRPAGHHPPFAGGGTQFRRTASRRRRRTSGVADEVAVAPDGSVYIADRRTASATSASTASSRPPAAELQRTVRSATAARRRHANARPRRRPRGLRRGRAVHRRQRRHGPRIRRVDAGGHDLDRRRRRQPARTAPATAGPAPTARLGSAYGMDFGPDGSLYFAERSTPADRPPPGAGRHDHDGRPAADGAELAGRRRAAARGPGSARSSACRSRRTAATTSPRTAPVNFSGRVRRVSRPLPGELGGAGVDPVRRRRARRTSSTTRAATCARSTASPARRCSRSPTTAPAGSRRSTDADGNATTVERARRRADRDRRARRSAHRAAAATRTAGSTASRRPENQVDHDGVHAGRADDRA